MPFRIIVNNNFERPYGKLDFWYVRSSYEKRYFTREPGEAKVYSSKKVAMMQARQLRKDMNPKGTVRVERFVK